MKWMDRISEGVGDCLGVQGSRDVGVQGLLVLESAWAWKREA